LGTVITPGGQPAEELRYDLKLGIDGARSAMQHSKIDPAILPDRISGSDLDMSYTNVDFVVLADCSYRDVSQLHTCSFATTSISTFYREI